MTILQTLQTEAGAKRLLFLVIGGLAVNQYGWSRETADIDIFAKRKDRETWIRWFTEMGYTIFHDGQGFIQFTPPTGNAWPVDIMWVNDESFDGMHAESVEAPIGKAHVRIPKLDHLLALKLHSLKNARIHRFLKDFQDIVGLIEVNKLDPSSERVRALFQKYANEDLYGKVLRACS